MWFRVVAMVVTQELVRAEALIVIGDVHLSLFALTSLQTLLEMKIIVFY